MSNEQSLHWVSFFKFFNILFRKNEGDWTRSNSQNTFTWYFNIIQIGEQKHMSLWSRIWVLKSVTTKRALVETLRMWLSLMNSILADDVNSAMFYVNPIPYPNNTYWASNAKYWTLIGNICIQRCKYNIVFDKFELRMNSSFCLWPLWGTGEKGFQRCEYLLAKFATNKVTPVMVSTHAMSLWQCLFLFIRCKLPHEIIISFSAFLR